MKRLDFEITFELASGLHTTGDRAELWVDKTLALDWHVGKRPIMPATSLKGWFRENAERILRGSGKKVCEGSSPSSICGKCFVCRVFGHPRRKAPLFFEDGRFGSDWSDTRTNVSLNRRRKTAQEERLFVTEVAWGRILTVKGWGFFATADEAVETAALLWLAAQAGFALGAARSRGLGWVKLREFNARCDGQRVCPEEWERRARELLGG